MSARQPCRSQRPNAAAIEAGRQGGAALAQRLGALEAEQAAAQVEIQRLVKAQAEQAALAEQAEGERRQLAAALSDLGHEGASLQPASTC